MAVDQAVDRIPGRDPTDLHWVRWSRSFLHAPTMSPSTMLLIEQLWLRHLIQPYTCTCTTFNFLHRLICMRKWLKLNALRKRMKTSTFLPLTLSSHCNHSNLLPSLRTKWEKIGRCKTMPSPSIQGTCQNWAQQPFRFKMWCQLIISGMAILFERLKRGRWSCKILSAQDGHLPLQWFQAGKFSISMPNSMIWTRGPCHCADDLVTKHNLQLDKPYHCNCSKPSPMACVLIMRDWLWPDWGDQLP